MATSAASQFARAQRLPAAEAIAYMQGRDRVTVSYHYSDVFRQAHGQQFTISRLARADLLQSLYDGLIQSVNGDLSRTDWMRNARELLQKEGWWGTKEIVDPGTGEIVKTTFNNARLALIYDTNMRQAHAAGQWQRLRRGGPSTYLRYVTMDDDRVRPLHRLWHNVVLPIGDEWWLTRFPPNGYRCRCRVVNVSKAAYERGYSESRPGAAFNTNAPVIREYFKKERPPDPPERLWRNPSTGNVIRIPGGIDPGFDYNPGMSALMQGAMDALVRDKLAKLTPEIAAAALSAGMTAPKVAKEVAGQSNWVSLELADLRTMTPIGSTPALLERADTLEGAAEVLRNALGVPPGGERLVMTPTGAVRIEDRLLTHVVEKMSDGRERFGNFVLPALQTPDEVWVVDYDDNTARRRFIKIFSGAKYDIVVIVLEQADGSVVWNMFNRERKAMNALRVGRLIYRQETWK